MSRARYNSTPPTLQNDGWTDLQVDSAGNLKIAVASESTNYLTSSRTTEGQVKAGAGFIHTLTISPLVAVPTAGLLTVYDSLTEANTVLYSEWVFATAPGHTIILDVPFATGLFIGFDGTLANVSVTSVYR